MKHNWKLSNAIKVAMGISITMSLPFATSAIAADDDKKVMLEEVVITGSRIKRTEFSVGAQVVSIDREQIDASGALLIADVLRSSPLNSLGSFSERSGSTAQSNAFIDLRGLDERRTLVMINGRRMTGSPSEGAATVNINMIPMAAVERIDILADGGSATYGSDAVAGVVNMVMRENFEGLEFSMRHGERSEDDGVEEGFSLLGGIKNDRGSVTWAVEYDSRDMIFDRDRSYTSSYVNQPAGGGLPTQGVDTEGISVYGKTIEIYSDSTGYKDIQAATNCPTDNGFTGVMNYSIGTACTYDYGAISASKAALTRINSYFSADYQINEQVEAFTTVLFSQVDSLGRYAPPAATWDDMPDDYADIPYDIDALLADGVIGDDYEITGYYRWTNIGPRDNEIRDTQYDIVTGLRGDFTNGISYETYLQNSRYDVADYGYHYLSEPGLKSVLAAGIDPFSEEGTAALKTLTTQDNSSEIKKMYGHVQIPLGDLFSAGEVDLLVGSEYTEFSYENKVDPQSEAGLVGGSSGNSSSGFRDATALFVETIAPVVNGVVVSAALRYDDYSDFGNEVSPSLSATWDVNDQLHLRTRWSQGFRAPALDELYGPDVFSAESATDYTTCFADGVSAEDCRESQYDTYFQTNEDLEAETSETFSVGGAWEFIENWTLDLNYWVIAVDDRIRRSETNEVLLAEAAGVELIRNGPAWVDRDRVRPVIYSTYINDGKLEVEGLDLKLLGLVDTEFGAFGFDFIVTQTLSYEEAAYYHGPNQDVSGYNLKPDLNARAAFSYNRGLHSVNLIVTYVGAHSEANFINNSLDYVTSDKDLESWTTADLSYQLDLSNMGYGAIKIGGRNITNEDPVLDKNGKFARDHYDLYDNTGRVLYAEYKIKF
jgi:iron complex outermembrane recepter protein